jgi:hypothetical protein
MFIECKYLPAEHAKGIFPRLHKSVVLQHTAQTSFLPVTYKSEADLPCTAGSTTRRTKIVPYARGWQAELKICGKNETGLGCVCLYDVHTGHRENGQHLTYATFVKYVTYVVQKCSLYGRQYDANVRTMETDL